MQFPKCQQKIHNNKKFVYKLANRWTKGWCDAPDRLNYTSACDQDSKCPVLLCIVVRLQNKVKTKIIKQEKKIDLRAKYDIMISNLNVCGQNDAILLFMYTKDLIVRGNLPIYTG